MLRGCVLLARPRPVRQARQSLAQARLLASHPPQPSQLDQGLHQEEEKKDARRDYRYIFPEFLPDPNPVLKTLLLTKFV